jgi:endonuclease/exonuclease/phosphatase family metal-dependent hydrolase
MFIRQFTKRFFILANLLVALALIITTIVPYISMINFWWTGFLPIAFPYLIVAAIAFIIFWLFAKRRFMLISIIALAVCYKQLPVLYAFNSQKSFTMQKQPTSLRIMSWNVKVFEGLKKGMDAIYKNTDNIFETVKTYNPDVVCMQEFSQYDSATQAFNHVKRMQQLGYTYYLHSEDYKKVKANFINGVAIFSKTPLSNTSRQRFTSNAESIINASVVHNNDTINIYTTHLQSYKLNRTDLRNIKNFANPKDSAIYASGGLFQKFKRSVINREDQSKQIIPLLNQSPYPAIFCADMNDVPNSNTYWNIRGKLNDAFLEKGNGIGRTFISLAPTLRIDYIFTDKQFAVKQFNIDDNRFSDHLAIIADVELIK